VSVSTAISLTLLSLCDEPGRPTAARPLRCWSPIEFVDDVALAQHQYAVAEAEQLGQLTGDHHDADPVGRQVGDDSVDLRPGANVDTASWLVE